MTYLLQVQTKDAALMLNTEVQADTIKELQSKAIEMVKRNRCVVGLSYIIAQVKPVGKFEFETKTLKRGTIEG